MSDGLFIEKQGSGCALVRRMVTPVVTGAIVDKESCGRFVVGYEAVSSVVGGKLTVAETGKVGGEVPASPWRWRVEPDLDASGCAILECISDLSQKSLRGGSRGKGTEGPSADLCEEKQQ